jgi:hypothetical protein
MVKRQVIPNWRGALELLAGSADGRTEALLFAHGFTEATIAGLIDTGLVAATTKRVLAGRGTVDLTWFKITGRGRAAMETVTMAVPRCDEQNYNDGSTQNDQPIGNLNARYGCFPVKPVHHLSSG